VRRSRAHARACALRVLTLLSLTRRMRGRVSGSALRLCMERRACGLRDCRSKPKACEPSQDLSHRQTPSLQTAMRTLIV